MSISQRYTDGTYAAANPGWHIADSPWKARQVITMLAAFDSDVQTICEVGCGAGEILRQIHDQMTTLQRLVGYEISEAPLNMARARSTDRLTFVLGDAAKDDEHFDLMLIMDVIEHVSDPIAFLESVRSKAERSILHIPLDLSAHTTRQAHFDAKESRSYPLFHSRDGHRHRGRRRIFD
ncbi:MAG: methyltransferase domain-containing protein [Solirubrobacteraceae bacterium]